jgi:hypothetical protein
MAPSSTPAETGPSPSPSSLERVRPHWLADCRPSPGAPWLPARASGRQEWMGPPSAAPLRAARCAVQGR